MSLSLKMSKFSNKKAFFTFGSMPTVLKIPGEAKLNSVAKIPLPGSASDKVTRCQHVPRGFFNISAINLVSAVS